MKTASLFCIKAEYSYYAGTLRAPRSGYLTDEFSQTQEKRYFSSVADAASFLKDRHGAEYSTETGEFTPAGQYDMRHGEYSRPVFRLVGAGSGRTSKAIYAALDAMHE